MMQHSRLEAVSPAITQTLTVSKAQQGGKEPATYQKCAKDTRSFNK